jgi:hypothetical protein
MGNNMCNVSNDHRTCGIQFRIQCDLALDVGAFIVFVTSGISALGFSIGWSHINKGIIGALVVPYTGLDGNSHDYYVLVVSTMLSGQVGITNGKTGKRMNERC